MPIYNQIVVNSYFRYQTSH